MDDNENGEQGPLLEAIHDLIGRCPLPGLHLWKLALIAALAIVVLVWDDIQDDIQEFGR